MSFACLQDDIYGAEIYGEAVPQFERPAPSTAEADVPAYEPLYSVKQARLELCYDLALQHMFERRLRSGIKHSADQLVAPPRRHLEATAIRRSWRS